MALLQPVPFQPSESRIGSTRPQLESLPLFDPRWWIVLAFACICVALYAIQRTLMEILKTLRAIRLEAKVDVKQFLRDEGVEVPDVDTSTGAKAN